MSFEITPDPHEFVPDCDCRECAINQRKRLHDALAELIADLELRADLKIMPEERGIVDCSDGIYVKCKDLLGQLPENPRSAEG